ncbi:efflux transporter outer membrane subunit [Pseudoxanthomonas sp. LARHCG66]
MLVTDTLEARKDSLDLIDKRRSFGAANELEYKGAWALVQQASAELVRTERQFLQADNALTLLVGTNQLEPLAPEAVEHAVIIQDIAAGAPSEMLENRPDIRSAELKLRARYADIGAARAAFFPRVSLTGFLGSASDELSGLFESGQKAWSFVPQINIPIFSGGRNRANLDLAHVRKDMAIAEYEGVIQTVFREVSDALAATETLRKEERTSAELAANSASVLSLAEARYTAGLDDHLRYLDAQRSDLEAQIALIEVRTQREMALVGLFRALGGSWSKPSEISASSAEHRPQQ